MHGASIFIFWATCQMFILNVSLFTDQLFQTQHTHKYTDEVSLSLHIEGIYSSFSQDSDLDHILWRNIFWSFQMRSGCSAWTLCDLQFPDGLIA